MPNLGPASPQVIVNADYLSRLTVSNAQVTPGILVGIPFLFSGTVTQTLSAVLAEKFEVVDVVCRKDAAGAGNTVQAFNSATAISDAIAFATNKAVTRAGTIDTAQNVIAAGGTLNVTATFAAGTVAGLVTVWGLIRP